MNIKSVLNFFTSPDKIDSSTVEMKIEIPTPTKKELFDNAVDKVVRMKIAVAVANSMTDECYSEQEINETELAYAMKRADASDEDIQKKYPFAVHHHDGYRYSYETPFSLER